MKRSLCAQHGIAEFWIVNLTARQVEVCRLPQGEQYGSVTLAGPGDMLEPALLPGAAIAVTALLG
ncbi:MAG: Uma2 family endonuclease [Acetobacteraceae bacterium]